LGIPRKVKIIQQGDAILCDATWLARVQELVLFSVRYANYKSAIYQEKVSRVLMLVPMRDCKLIRASTYLCSATQLAKRGLVE
jgi:hypothetical protein